MLQSDAEMRTDGNGAPRSHLQYSYTLQSDVHVTDCLESDCRNVDVFLQSDGHDRTVGL